jgi:IS1 family transposase
MSVRSTVRITGTAKGTVLRLIADMGEVCLAYQDKTLRNLPCKRLQCDEIWSFCYSKDKNVPSDKRGQFGYGDVWTWVAMCADTKLVPCWLVGPRDMDTAVEFMEDLRGRLARRVQLTTDGHRAYLDAVEQTFGADIDYATLTKLYGVEPPTEDQRRYSPSHCIGAEAARIIGNPDPDHVSTSLIERQNLTMRTGMRRFTRLTNGFSKKIENHCHALALHYMYYNFCRIHQTLRVTPAMEAGVARKPWEIEDIVGLLEQKECQFQNNGRSN